MTNPFTFNAKPFDTAQLESVFGPARAFAALSIDVTEKLVNAQFDAAKAYTDANLAQLRQLVEVKDAEGLRSYVEGQQQVAKDLTERLKEDAEKVVALQQDFVQESQKLTEGSVQQAQEGLQQATETATTAAKETASKSSASASSKTK
ncbi:phasin family protein [Halomonas cerina]|uniref:Phasin family protein n=1 Tax=Halomonas cerina TaxID=447424 RepID=A0A839VDY0_9GAMM|nr:phasin family protein [Halomonas cerina]MBB3192170.1 phasin family protein [Halomonas cerina]